MRHQCINVHDAQLSSYVPGAPRASCCNLVLLQIANGKPVVLELSRYPIVLNPLSVEQVPSFFACLVRY
jgi:hypothetical protein